VGVSFSLVVVKVSDDNPLSLFFLLFFFNFSNFFLSSKEEIRLLVKGVDSASIVVVS